MPVPSTSRALIDLGAYAHNLAVVRQSLPAECGLMAVVKTNAYGLGAVPMARRAVETGAAMLAVATVKEGVELREAGVEAPILTLLQPCEDMLGAVVEYGLRAMVSEVGLAQHLGELARRANRVVPVHCKVDTGMSRQGVPLEQAEDTLLALTRVSHIDIEGIATHFATADLADDAFTRDQIRAFKHLLKKARKAGIPYEIAHAANSAAIVDYPESAFDIVRPGLITYGVWPTPRTPSPNPLRPVLRWESRIVLVKDLEAGASVGYGRTFKTQHPTRLAIVPVGYADGYRYSLANRANVLIHGQRCPVRGNVCMDQIAVDVTNCPAAKPGDTATLIGADGDAEVTVRELADLAGTVPNDILTGLGWRVTREYIG